MSHVIDLADAHQARLQAKTPEERRSAAQRIRQVMADAGQEVVYLLDDRKVGTRCVSAIWGVDGGALT
jgi:hypothetical protein